MKRFALAIALACVLSGSALAGDISTAGAPAPAPGDAHSTGAPSPAAAAESSSLAATVLLAILSFIR